jgi:hypothetical protein
MITNNFMAEGCTQKNNAGMQGNINKPLPAETVTSLSEEAHSRINELAQEIERLGEALYPVRCATDEGVLGQAEQSHDDYPKCIQSLRILVQRISHLSQKVRTIYAEVRV